MMSRNAPGKILHEKIRLILTEGGTAPSNREERRLQEKKRKQAKRQQARTK